MTRVGDGDGQKPLSRLVGRYVTLERLTVEHLTALWSHVQNDDALWTYTGRGPFANAEEFIASAEKLTDKADPLTYAIVDKAQGAVGYGALVRGDAAIGVVEVGSVLFSKAIQRTCGATEAIFLLLEAAFSTGKYTRVRWKCNEQNRASRKAAERFGFTFEGIQPSIYKIEGVSPFAAWFVMSDKQWPTVKNAFERWLDASNFDEQGTQRRSLPQIRAELIAPA